MTDQPRLLTLEEISAITRLPLGTLRHYRQHGEGPRTFRVGRRVMAYESDVIAWLDERRNAEG